MLGRRFWESHLMELPLTSKRRRSAMRRAARAIFCGVREERTVLIRWRQASKSIHESTQDEICQKKEFSSNSKLPFAL
jgi:hypothetical protein